MAIQKIYLSVILLLFGCMMTLTDAVAYRVELYRKIISYISAISYIGE
jgi:hypothetical protein